MSALDQVKGKKTVIFAVVAAIVVLVAYLFIGQSGKESEPEEVISKRVRLEVVEEPAPGRMEDQNGAGPQGAVGVPEQGESPDTAITEGPEAITEKPSAVKETHKAPAAAKPVKPAEEAQEKAVELKPKAKKESLKEPPVEPRHGSEKGAVQERAAEKKPARHAVKGDVESTDSSQKVAETKEAAKKQPKKTSKASKAITDRDIAARPWVVGLASFKTLGEAQEVTGSLKAMHHNAYITETVKDGRKWYRVRVGFYASREDAEKVGKSLSTRFGLKSLWVVKPSRAEAKAHFK